MNEKKSVLLHNVAQKIFEEATAASLGATFHVIISFHLKQKFGKDPYEVLIENPKTFYNGLKEVLGAGAEAIVHLVGTYLNVKYGLNYASEEFVRIFTKDGLQSRRKLSDIICTVVAEEEKKIVR